MAWIPILLVENSQQQRSTSAAVESFRNEMAGAASIKGVFLPPMFSTQQLK
jgi:hypothetical protein